MNAINTPYATTERAAGSRQARPHIKSAIHGHVYRWVSERIDGGTVLDAGCGDGRGTAMLANVAAWTVGVDCDPAMVKQAQERYAERTLNFVAGDCQDMALPSESFDYVISNALLEYLPNVPQFLAEAARVLKRGGIAYIGTKNAALSLKRADGSPLYSNHLQEYSSAGLRDALRPHFIDIEILGEHMKGASQSYIMDRRALGFERILVATNIKHSIPRSIRDSVRKRITGVDLKEISAADFEITNQNIENALYLIGYAKKP